MSEQRFPEPSKTSNIFWVAGHSRLELLNLGLAYLALSSSLPNSVCWTASSQTFLHRAASQAVPCDEGQLPGKNKAGCPRDAPEVPCLG